MWLSSLPAAELNTSSISSSDTFAVSGTEYVAHRYARKQAAEKVTNVALQRVG
jgi:hypothetical protein